MKTLNAPHFPESIPEGTLIQWHAKPGDAIYLDDLLAEIETDKAIQEVLATQDGYLVDILVREGQAVTSAQPIAKIRQADNAHTPHPDADNKMLSDFDASPTPAPIQEGIEDAPKSGLGHAPSVRNLARATGLDPDKITGTGRGGRVTKADFLSQIAKLSDANTTFDRQKRTEPMSRLRRRASAHLLAAKQSTAMLTTFNEVNMKPIMDLRKKHGARFVERHGAKLGLLSPFVVASAKALAAFPPLNAQIDGNNIIYHDYVDIGVAVSTPRGLLVPVIKDAHVLSLAQIEKTVADFAVRGKTGKFELDDLTGGTFTITNGGVFGSLLSTPILNPPQSAILGMHAIKDRVMAVDGQMQILPMMYIALSYDHRLIDGKDAVLFLDYIRQLIEDPSLLLLD